MQTLAEQGRAVSSLRARAGTVLAAASISASFLGTMTSQGAGLDAWSMLALIAFALTVVTAIWVFWPNPFTFGFESRSLLGANDEQDGVDVLEGYRAAVIRMSPWIDANRGGIQQLATRFGCSCFSLLLEIGCWPASSDHG